MRSKETKIERWIDNERSSKILMYHPMCHAILKKAFLLFSQESNGNSMRMIERMIILNYSWSGKIIYIEIEEKFIRV